MSCHFVLFPTTSCGNLLSFHLHMFMLSVLPLLVLELKIYIKYTKQSILHSWYHYSCNSAGALLSPSAEAQQWKGDAKGDTTEQRGRRGEPDATKQTQGKAAEQSKTSTEDQYWEQTWESRGWSSHCVSSQRSSQSNSRWINHTCLHIHIFMYPLLIKPNKTCIIAV